MFLPNKSKPHRQEMLWTLYKWKQLIKWFYKSRHAKIKTKEFLRHMQLLGQSSSDRIVDGFQETENVLIKRTETEKKLLMWTPVANGLKLNTKADWTKRDRRPWWKIWE